MPTFLVAVNNIRFTLRNVRRPENNEHLPSWKVTGILTLASLKY